jgi:hypothetical protein
MRSPFGQDSSALRLAENGRYNTPSPPSEHQTWPEVKEQAQSEVTYSSDLYRLARAAQRRIGTELADFFPGWPPLDCSTVQ